MNRLLVWAKRVMVALSVLVAGLLAFGAHLIMDRRQMYGSDPANDPYSPDFDPNRRRR